MTGNEEWITLKKESTSDTFDHCIKGRDGELIGLEIELRHMAYANLHIRSSHTILGIPATTW